MYSELTVFWVIMLIPILTYYGVRFQRSRAKVSVAPLKDAVRDEIIQMKIELDSIRVELSQLRDMISKGTMS